MSDRLDELILLSYAWTVLLIAQYAVAVRYNITVNGEAVGLNGLMLVAIPPAAIMFAGLTKLWDQQVWTRAKEVAR